MKKEIWVLPCNYSGFATVYFDGDLNRTDGRGELKYILNDQGVAHVNSSVNDGFASKLKDVVIILEDCEGKVDTIPYYENEELDTVTVDRYATHLVVGKKGKHSFRSINIVRSN